MSGRAGALAMALLAALALAPAEARAGAVCSNSPGAGARVSCTRSNAAAIAITLPALTITTSGAAHYGVHAHHTGTGALTIGLTGVGITTSGASAEGVFGWIDGASNAAALTLSMSGGSVSTSGANAAAVETRHDGTGGIDVDLRNAAIRTTSSSGTSHGVFVQQGGAGGGGIDLDIQGGSVSTASGNSYAVSAKIGSTNASSSVVDVSGATITTAGAASHGVYNWNSTTAAGQGTLSTRVTGGSVTTGGDQAHAVHSVNFAAGSSAPVEVRVTDASLSTTGGTAHAVFTRSTGTGGIDVDLSGAVLRTTGATNAYAVRAESRSANGGGIDVDVSGGSITTAGGSAFGVLGWVSRGTSGEAISLSLRDAARIATAGHAAHGVYALHYGPGATGINLADASISTTGSHAVGVNARNTGADGAGSISISAENAAITTTHGDAFGVFAWQQSLGAVGIDVSGGSISTRGGLSRGVYVWTANAASEADVDVAVRSGARIRTEGGRGAHAVHALHQGVGGVVDIDLADASVTTTGDIAHGLYGWIWRHASEGAIDIATAGGSVTAEGLFALGLRGYHNGLGSAALTIGEGTRVRSPFYIGATTRLTNDANASGRGVIVNRGAIEALDAGVFAYGDRASGSTFGEGIQTADDAARTEPMLHVISGGDISVGQAPTDAFIRERIAGSDGTLSAGESAVLSAVTEGDSGALETALASLPAAYDEDWKAQARELLRKRGYESTSASGLAGRAAVEILGLFRAGVRALAMSYASVADYVRRGDRDPAILAKAASARTSGEQATLAEQERLSAPERSVLAAILTGGDLEGALAALPSSYSDAYREGARRLAGEYNAGDIRVEVTGGTITAEGGGVEAIYAVPHERNGAISVSVAQGASVSGGRDGIYVGGAGAGEGNFLAQSVAVDGQVAGGTRAGVYMRGGGRLMVGETGRVGAGVLADGPGDFYAAVAGRVEGDIRGTGSGAHTVTVAAGGEVTGTIHLAASDVRVDGTAGSVRFDRGGTLTVGPAGALRGIDGVAARSSGGAASRLHFSASLPRGRDMRDVIGDSWIINDGGGTNIFVNGVKLHDAERGATGLKAPVGGRTLIVRPRGIILDRDFSACDFLYSFAPRSGVYESLPGLVLRMESARSLRGAKKVKPGLPTWVRISAEKGRRGKVVSAGEGEENLRPDAGCPQEGASTVAGGSTTGTRYEFDYVGTEAGWDTTFYWAKGLSGSVSVRHQKGAASVLLRDGKGKIRLEGVGAATGLSWLGESGLYANAGASVMFYEADLVSEIRGSLKNDVGAVVHVLDLEAGQRIALGEELAVTPRVWLSRSEVSMDRFTDSAGARFELVRADRLSGGAGVVLETWDMPAAGGWLTLRASTDVEHTLSGENTVVEVSGERLRAEDSDKTRLLLGLGARWRKGRRFTAEGDVTAAGLGSDDRSYGGSLRLGVRF